MRHGRWRRARRGWFRRNGVLRGANPPAGGAIYDADPNEDTLTLGAGGGGVWNGGSPTAAGCTFAPGPGGNGGGVLAVYSQQLALTGGVLLADGEDARSGSTGTNVYGAGGGAGGVVQVAARELAISGASSRIAARRGAGLHPPGACIAVVQGNNASVLRAGGDGGGGVVRLVLGAVNGFAPGTGGANTVLSTYCQPNPQQVQVLP